MLHLFLEEKQKIELLCRQCFETIGPDEAGFSCSNRISNALIRTLRLIDISPVDPIHIQKLIEEETKQNFGRINIQQFTAVVRRVFVEAFYPRYSEVLGSDN